MARSLVMRHAAGGQSPDGFGVQIKFDGELATRGELPAGELGAALLGWDRFFQLAVHSHESARIELPKSDTLLQVELHVLKVRKGSFVVEATIFIAGAAVNGIFGNAAYDVIKNVWGWSNKLIRTHIKAKREAKTLDGVVDEVEKLAKVEKINISDNREDTEDFVSAINAALNNATVPLDSSAAREVLSLKGQPIEIVIDKQGRSAIRAPFDPPALDPDADEVIEAGIKFVRINRKTGTGLFYFMRPLDESQQGQQRFHSDDRSIRKRANVYTGAFHEDMSIKVRMQRKAYEQNRRGHYWLILGTATPEPEEQTLFGPQRSTKKRRRKK